MLLTLLLALPADWPQFRGPAGDSRAATPVPTDIRPEKVVWAVEVPGSGWAQPVAVGGTVFVASAVSDPPIRPKDMAGGTRGLSALGGSAPPDVTLDWTLFALDLATGNRKWAAKVATGKPAVGVHPSNTFATETPCADADRVYVYFATAGVLAALDHAGNEVWRNTYPPKPTLSNLGPGASPALADGRLYLALANEAEARLLCLDPATGKELWAAARDKPGTAWATPFVWRTSKRTEVVFCGKGRVTSHDPATGTELWRLGGIDSSFSASPAAAGDVLVFGNGGPGSVSPLYGVRAGATGDITPPKGQTTTEHVAFYRRGAAPGMSSPVAVGDKVYVFNGGGLACYTAATGEPVYKERLPRTGMIAAAPVAAGDTLLYLDEKGTAVAVKAGDTFEVVGGGKLDDQFWSSPAAAGDRLLLRGVNKLYCVGR
jgi:outer membrane protein assembly factor BamB